MFFSQGLWQMDPKDLQINNDSFFVFCDKNVALRYLGIKEKGALFFKDFFF